MKEVTPPKYCNDATLDAAGGLTAPGTESSNPFPSSGESRANQTGLWLIRYPLGK